MDFNREKLFFFLLQIVICYFCKSDAIFLFCSTLTNRGFHRSGRFQFVANPKRVQLRLRTPSDFVQLSLSTHFFFAANQNAVPNPGLPQVTGQLRVAGGAPREDHGAQRRRWRQVGRCVRDRLFSKRVYRSLVLSSQPVGKLLIDVENMNLRSDRRRNEELNAKKAADAKARLSAAPGPSIAKLKEDR